MYGRISHSTQLSRTISDGQRSYQSELVSYGYVHSFLIILTTYSLWPGTIRLIPAARCRQARWRETTAFKASNKPVKEPNSIWTFCASISAVSEDICKANTWVFARADSVC